MKKLWVIVVLVLLLVLLGVFGWQRKNITTFVEDWRARRVVYSETDERSKYGGVGEIKQPVLEQLFVMSKGPGAPFYASSNEQTKYPDDEYEVTVIPAQDMLVYSVGRFVRWESVGGSKDKYMVVQNPITKVLMKYRVALESSDIFKLNETAVEVENTKVYGTEVAQNQVKMLDKPKVIDIGYDVLKKLIRVGDVVVLRPVLDPPELAKKDGEGISAVSWITLRRSGGKQQIEDELNRIKGTK
jgi:hypothetical protein